jgi:hypothetical protein
MYDIAWRKNLDHRAAQQFGTHESKRGTDSRRKERHKTTEQMYGSVLLFSDCVCCLPYKREVAVATRNSYSIQGAEYAINREREVEGVADSPPAGRSQSRCSFYRCGGKFTDSMKMESVRIDADTMICKNDLTCSHCGIVQKGAEMQLVSGRARKIFQCEHETEVPFSPTIDEGRALSDGRPAGEMGKINSRLDIISMLD